ncbi:hypothetical protein RFI_19266 [Reticulomyxa filosa]|uniref:Serine aminopeptidase S33 domain-containing protein n=1 Tax=Reticulomyxa filosa TaxID=46433 RepID=X6MY70_RETFI|nr:hypothetical protein RFI_19266 [Reticulomyxa filosa]|eukprot:ETO18030.1 hypothetical protein RFI_19266 [Reticulomyxa filosa]
MDLIRSVRSTVVETLRSHSGAFCALSVGLCFGLLHYRYHSNLQDDVKYRRVQCLHDPDHCPTDPPETAPFQADFCYESTPSGDILFTGVFWPRYRLKKEVKGVVFFLHGYGSSVSGPVYEYCGRLAKMGYGVVACEYPCHGRSDGRYYVMISSYAMINIYTYIYMWSALIENVMGVLHKIRDKHFSVPGKRLKTFLFGESMGGAVALNMSRKYSYDGLILVSPMCKIAAETRPPIFMERLLMVLAFLIPTWPIVPSKDWSQWSCHDSELTAWLSLSPLYYSRLATGLQLLKVTENIEQMLCEFDDRMLILHGSGDVVTDPFHSKALFEKSKSKDKTLIFYEDQYHKLLSEPQVKHIVWEDIRIWLDNRNDDKFVQKANGIAQFVFRRSLD